MANYVLGFNGKLYISATLVTAATNAALLAGATTGSTIVTLAQDVNVDLSTDKADITTRGNSGWGQEVPTLKKGTLKFKMLWKPADAGIGILQTAWLANAEIFAAALDGAVGTSGNQGPAGNFTVTNFSRNEGLKDAMTLEIELSASSFNGWLTTT
jgi:hypothetical protein